MRLNRESTHFLIEQTKSIQSIILTKKLSKLKTIIQS